MERKSSLCAATLEKSAFIREASVAGHQVQGLEGDHGGSDLEFDIYIIYI